MVKKTSTIIEPEIRIENIHVEERRKIGILGGTFNPPHLGHLIIADQVRDQLGLEKIIFLPSANPPHAKGKTTIDAKHRVRMVEKAIELEPQFELDFTEINRGGKSFTFDTIKSLTEQNPDIEYYFIIGADMVEDLPSWYKIDELVNLVQIVAVNRPQYSVETAFPLIFIDVPNIEISSSTIRQKISDQCSVKFLLPDKVLEYIEAEGLYHDGV
ncbi:nicotinate-nucleotide adenylyltransferase [Marinilactibacillus psychrotolerans]|uniref:Probable nicotinate-nucleotide adenylyltransferase n=1 Tax=Marinilactibacillus psychrotolerans TaxID=191770 RepID=A0AAV3WND9_9LACT|nr:nicotinate-nucleotide adenylyltransferase [Marinilactibacillus psychrotolerans]GEL66061.1 putative nicotinate-nucleotide adenylyltransferase [Marinilactibacillus psychrotolerans]GEQ33107.1 nicotinic acid mononucleotide adenylyltransferase [Marinilactibacillus psychrotolerans]GEQ34570.1 nicotinic acid mononucleotide adenylyltransferase [Marinilactibacillus psychrotolerans]SDB99439.1 nicotinate-nucleotide adenylyltransferase [Marinilactibacillus psychrotolerans]